MIDRANHEAELWWYFTVASTACGLKSSAGAWELMAKLGVPLDGGSKWMDGGPEERDLEAFQRARAIWQRLEAIGTYAARVLEKQYSDAATIGRVSVSLIASLRTVAADHDRSSETSIKRYLAKGLPLPDNSVARMTHRGWVLSLAGKHDTELAQYRAEAERELDAALTAYCSAVKP